MKIKELKPGQGSVNIELTVKSLDPIKEIDKYGKKLRLRNATVTDGDSEIKLTLWNDDVDKVKTGIIVKITNGYVNEFNGEKQLTTGKFGKLEILGQNSEEETEKNSKEEFKEEEESSDDDSDESEESSEEDY